MNYLSEENYHFSYFHKGLSSLALSMWVQSAIKHVLTQGDSILVAWLTTNHEQGVYAFAANYGSLIARMLFQPVEESSRSLFAKLLSKKDKEETVVSENLTSAGAILKIILRLYVLLSLFFVSLGSAFAPVALSVVAGKQWATSEAGKVLSAFCFYIPLLAINGITEAFVQSVATKRELATQSGWMFTFSIGFAGVGWTFLKALGWGAQGLVAANAVNMLVRISWSSAFIERYFRRNGARMQWREVFPSLALCSATVGVAAVARSVAASDGEVVKIIAIAGTLGIFLAGIWYELFPCDSYSLRRC